MQTGGPDNKETKPYFRAFRIPLLTRLGLVRAGTGGGGGTGGDGDLTMLTSSVDSMLQTK